MKRREFIGLAGGAVVTWPLAGRAQQKPMPMIGYLSAFSAPSNPSGPGMAAFRQGLSDTGYVEGRNLVVEYRSAEGRYDRLPGFATELVGLRVDVIVAISGVAALAAKAATATIPIVFIGAVEPFGLGLAASIQQPGGNVTGVAGSFDALEDKRLQLLHELAPAATRIGYLVNPENPNSALRPERLAAARQALGVEVIPLMARHPEEFEAALAAGGQAGIGALLVPDDPFFIFQARQLIELVASHSVPAMYPAPFFVASGGLIAYGTRGEDRFYQAGTYVARILKGAKPAELPIMQPTKFELLINLKTANALGLTVPPSLLARADEVIE